MTIPRPPWTLLLTVLAAAVEAVGLLALAVLDLASIGGASSVGGVLAGGVLLVAFAAGMGWCAYALLQRQSRVRAPIVVVQLIVIGVAWNGRGGLMAACLFGLAIVALVGIFLPPSIRALEHNPQS